MGCAAVEVVVASTPPLDAVVAVSDATFVEAVTFEEAVESVCAGVEPARDAVVAAPPQPRSTKAMHAIAPAANVALIVERC